MKKLRIALVCGGFSKENVISVRSAATIAEHLSPERFETYKIVIDPDRWYYAAPEAENGAAAQSVTAGNAPQKTSDQTKTYDIDKNDFSLNLPDGKVTFDAALIAIHGDPGENGRLQGYFDMLHLPYTTCNACTSALTFNKAYCNAVLAHNGIRVAPSLHLFREECAEAPQREAAALRIAEEIGFPCFIKPNAGGSSIGMSKVNEAAQLPEALEKAFAEDTEVLAEAFVQGNEYSCGLMRCDGTLQVFPLTQIVPDTEFFDYEAKYLGKSKEITPAPADPGLVAQIGEIAKRVYRILHGAGVVRCDFIVEEKTGDIYFLEVNTTPGQSAQSIVPQQIRHMGWTLEQFYETLIRETLCLPAL